MQIATFAVGDYYFAAAALINSLACAGYSGRVVVGHIGPIDWNVDPQAPIDYVNLSDAPEGFVSNQKAWLLGQLDSKDICFIDSDCIVTSPILLELIESHLTVRAFFTTEGLLAGSDVRWHVWKEVSDTTGMGAARCMTAIPYINAGLIALRMPRDWDYLSEWQRIMDTSLPSEGEMFDTPFFQMVDQDCLNAVIDKIGRPFASIGPPDIWYRGLPVNPYLCVGSIGKPLMLHCTGERKPWRFESNPLVIPDIYDLAFYRFAYKETPWVRLMERPPKKLRPWFENKPSSCRAVAMNRRLARFSRYLKYGSTRKRVG